MNLPIIQEIENCILQSNYDFQLGTSLARHDIGFLLEGMNVEVMQAVGDTLYLYLSEARMSLWMILEILSFYVMHDRTGQEAYLRSSNWKWPSMISFFERTLANEKRAE